MNATLYQVHISRIARFAALLPVLIAVCFRIAEPVYAGNTYYIDTANTGGNGCNDAWSGTVAQPFCTFAKASSIVRAGDTIVLRAGDYPPMTFTKSGTSSAPIEITAYQHERVIVHGAGDGILLKGASWVILTSLEVTGATGNWLAGIRITSDGGSYPQYDTVQNCIVHDNTGTNTAGILLEFASHSRVLGNTVYHNYLNGIDVTQPNEADPGFDLIGNEIIGNTVYENVLGAGNADGIHFLGSRIRQSIVSNNIVYGNGDDGIDTFSSPDNTVIGNISYNHTGPGDANGFKLGGISKITGSSTGGFNTIMQNVSFGNKSNGFDSNGSGGNLYYNNVAYNNGNMGFEDGWKEQSCSTTSCRTTYINNVGYNNGRANFSASAYTAVSHNNIWYSDTGGAKVLYDYSSYSNLDQFFSASGNRLDNPTGGLLASLSQNPQFTSTGPDGFRLRATSPAVNAGDPSNPAGISVVDRVDIGAYEFQSASKPGDANGDSIVDGRDFDIWTDFYGQPVSNTSNGNFDGEMGVDGKDYVIWMYHFGE